MRLNNLIKRNTAIEILASLLILLFVYAALSKLLNLPRSRFELWRQPLPGWSKPTLLYLIPGIELVVSALLVFPKTRLKGFWASLILMTAFSIYIILALSQAFGNIPCSCGGIMKNFTWTMHLFFNLFFVITAILGIVLSKKGSEVNLMASPTLG